MNLPRNPYALTRSVHTRRSAARRIIFMRYANEREIAGYAQSLG